MAKTLMLHIGHPKTGSSYLQSILAKNIVTLRELGVDYPEPQRADLAALGEISSGNLPRFDEMAADPSLLETVASNRLLFSGENFTFTIGNAGTQPGFAEFIADPQIERVDIILFIRDPVSFSLSEFQQLIKRGGKSELSLSAHMRRTSIPVVVNGILDFAESQPKVAITVRNYSAVRSTLVDEFCAWLGVPPNALSLPDAKVVNRSMTSSELMLLAAMNLHVDKSSNLIADALCNRLPDVVSDDMRPPIEDQLALWERLGPEIDRVNARVDPAHRYDKARDINPPNIMPDHAEFSAAQIQVIAETVADLIQKERDLRTNYRESLERNKDQQARLLMQRGVIAELRAQTLKQRGVIEDLQARLGKRPGATGDAGTKDPAPQEKASGPSKD